MKKRIITAIILFLIITPILIFDEVFILAEVMFSSLAIFASYELFKLSENKNKISRFIFPSFFTALNTLAISNMFNQSLIPGLSLKNYEYIYLIIPVITIIVSRLSTIKNSDSRNYYYLSMTYPGFGFGAILLLRAFDLKYLLFVILIITFTDMFALFIGKRFGKKKLAPTISPNKTVAGFLGGIIVSVFIATLIFIFYDKIFLYPTFLKRFNLTGGNILNILGYDIKPIFTQFIIIFIISIFISIIGQLGDLYASSIKRSAGIKDFSNIFPGHGGVLDRFDSLIFGSILFGVIILIGGIFWKK